jgi:arsenate reductase
MTYTLLHHTGCGTSRKGLALLEEQGIDVTVRKYMNASEQLSEEDLRDIARKMQAGSPRAFLRDKDAAKFDLAADASDDAVYAAMAANPRLIQRPIGICGGRACSAGRSSASSISCESAHMSRAGPRSTRHPYEPEQEQVHAGTPLSRRHRSLYWRRLGAVQA